jgi:hypothetical protein
VERRLYPADQVTLRWGERWWGGADSWAYLVGLATVGSAHVNAALFSTRRDPAQQSDATRSWPLPDLIREQWMALRGSSEAAE